MTSPYAIALSHFAPFGSRTYVRLFEFFKSYEAIWKASADELLTAGVSQATVAKFTAWRTQTNPEVLTDAVYKLGLEAIDRNDPRFPTDLTTLYDPPIILYVRGTLPTAGVHLSIVGSREATPYGLTTAKTFAHDLSKNGLIIVSGLARGIDTEAHLGALSAGGKTIAVLAHGHEELKGEKRAFSNKIVAAGGAIVSEQPPHLKAMNYHFPIRNCIIAGLSRGVLIVEAELPSGTLITAQCALNAHREVFAIPGPINTPTSAGTNKLLQDGAHVTTSVNDILLALGLPTSTPPPEPVLVPAPLPLIGTPAIIELDGLIVSREQALLLAHLEATPKHIDDLTRDSGLPAATVLAALTMLEIHGKVRPLGNMHYSL